MEAPTIGGVRVRKGNGETVRLPRGASLTDFAEKINVEPAQLVQMLFSLGEMVTATESVNDETLELLGEELNYVVQVVSPEDEDRELLESFDIEFGDDEERRGGPRGPSAGRHRHGSRRPRKDQAPRRAAQRERRRGRGRWHHPAHRCLPGVDRRRRRGPPDHLHRHPGSRGVHRHACPWFAVHGHRGPRGRGRRRRDAADGRGAQPRQGGRRADRGRGQQDRQAGSGPDQGPRPADRVRPGARGVRRRHDVRRRLGQVRAQPRQAARGGRADRRRVAGPAGQPRARRAGPGRRGAPGPRSRSGGDDPGPARHAARRRLDRRRSGPRPGPGDARRVRQRARGGRPVASGDGARSDRRARCGPELHRRRGRPDGAPDRREAGGARAGGHAGQAPRPPYPRGLHGLHGEGREPGAQPDPQGRRVRFGRGARGRAGQDRRRRRGQLRVIDRGVGAITETNVDLAAASDAIIIGFNVRPQGKATRAGRPRGRGDPVLLGHLPGHRGDRGRAQGHAQAGVRGVDPRPGGDPRDLPLVQDRQHRRLHGHQRA